MGKKESEVWEITIETVTAAAVLVFLGLQIYYVYVYKSSLVIMLYHLLPVVFLYVGMMVLQKYPELLNGFGSESLQGKVRMYAVRMVRNSKLLIVLGMLFPSAADALGIEMNGAYSLLIMGGILANIGYYLYRIYEYNSKQKGK